MKILIFALLFTGPVLLSFMKGDADASHHPCDSFVKAMGAMYRWITSYSEHPAAKYFPLVQLPKDILKIVIIWSSDVGNILLVNQFLHDLVVTHRLWVQMYLTRSLNECHYIRIFREIPDESERMHALMAVVHEGLDEADIVRGILEMPMKSVGATCYKLLAGEGPFGSLPIGVKQQIAKSFWNGKGGRKYCLSMFLSEYYKRFDLIRDILADVDIDYIYKTCFKLALGIQCDASIRDEELSRLVDSITLLYTGDANMTAIAGLVQGGRLSPHSDIGSIVKVFGELENEKLRDCMQCIRYSDEIICANKCSLLINSFMSRTLRSWYIGGYHLKKSFMERHGFTATQQQQLMAHCDFNDIVKHYPLESDVIDMDVEFAVALALKSQKNSLSMPSFFFVPSKARCWEYLQKGSRRWGSILPWI